MITDLTHNIQMMLEWNAAANRNSGDEMKEKGKQKDEEKNSKPSTTKAGKNSIGRNHTV